jgi:hypothetical protein
MRDSMDMDRKSTIDQIRINRLKQNVAQLQREKSALQSEHIRRVERLIANMSGRTMGSKAIREQIRQIFGI